jgi:hypothetical protein
VHRRGSTRSYHTKFVIDTQSEQMAVFVFDRLLVDSPDTLNRHVKKLRKNNLRRRNERQ